MARRVKDFIDIADFSSLDALIAALLEVQAGLPEGSEAELKLRGDDVFGRRLSIAYFREQTVEEAEIEARYAASCRKPYVPKVGARQQSLATEEDLPKRRSVA